MPVTKADIIASLKKDILPLQGFRSPVNQAIRNILPVPVNHAFPHHAFPLGAMHEYLCNGLSQTAATTGFIAGILSGLVRNGSALLWVGAARTVFPPALLSFGIAPDKIIFIDLKRERDTMWVMEEALKCEGLAAVVGEMRDLDFTASRRFQLAVEQSNVTGFILRRDIPNLSTTACIARWKITSMHSINHDDIPGVGFPKWNVELLKVRNGKPGSWEIGWVNGAFNYFPAQSTLAIESKEKSDKEIKI